MGSIIQFFIKFYYIKRFLEIFLKYFHKKILTIYPNNRKTINGILGVTHIFLFSINSILFSNKENINFFLPLIFFSIEVANLFF